MSSWVEKVGGESRWFKANKLEKEGRYGEALTLYLEEAKNQEERSPALTALSYLSAAKCALKLGRIDDASKLFLKAGKKYEDYGDSILSVSPNSSAWAYKMASRCYAWAGDDSSAEKALEKASSIAEKMGERGRQYMPLFKPYKPKKGEKTDEDSDAA